MLIRQENGISTVILSVILKNLQALPEPNYHAVEGRNKAKEHISMLTHESKTEIVASFPGDFVGNQILREIALRVE